MTILEHLPLLDEMGYKSNPWKHVWKSLRLKRACPSQPATEAVCH